MPIDENYYSKIQMSFAFRHHKILYALIALGSMFAGSLRSGQRATNIITLIQPAKLNELDPYAYLSDVLKRLPTHKMKDIEELLPHKWNST